MLCTIPAFADGDGFQPTNQPTKQNIQTDRQADRDKHTDRQADRGDRQTDRQMDRQNGSSSPSSPSPSPFTPPRFSVAPRSSQKLREAPRRGVISGGQSGPVSLRDSQKHIPPCVHRQKPPARGWDGTHQRPPARGWDGTAIYASRHTCGAGRCLRR